MDGAGTVLGERGEVVAGAVASVVCEAVVWVVLVMLVHHAVARYFRDDGCGGDGGAAGVSMDDGFLGTGFLGQDNGVDQQEVGPAREGVQRAEHRLPRSLDEAERIDLVMTGLADADGGGLVEQPREAGALSGGEQLRVVQIGPPGLGELGVEDNRGGDDGAGHGAAADFVDAGDVAVGGAPGEDLVTERGGGGHEDQQLASQSWVRTDATLAAEESQR